MSQHAPAPGSMIPPADAEQRQLASTRRALRYVAVLHGLLGALFLAGGVLFTSIAVPVAAENNDSPVGMLVFGGVCLIAGLLMAVSAVGLWRQRYRWAALLVSGVMLLAFPFGTVVGVLTLVLLSSPPGRALFASRDDAVVAPET